MTDIWAQLEKARIPVVTVNALANIESLVQKLRALKFTTIEVTLRSEQGLPAIRKLREIAPDILVGAGTLIKPEHVGQALEAGAQYLVSPGWSDLIWQEVAQTQEQVWLPGAITPTEVMRAYDKGYRRLKFFPAELSGGIPVLKNFLSLFPDIQFCPTGGVTNDNAEHYLALKNVFAVGGTTWLR